MRLFAKKDKGLENLTTNKIEKNEKTYFDFINYRNKL